MPRTVRYRIVTAEFLLGQVLAALSAASPVGWSLVGKVSVHSEAQKLAPELAPDRREQKEFEEMAAQWCIENRPNSALLHTN